MIVNGIVKFMIEIGPYDFGSIIEAKKIRSPFPGRNWQVKNKGG